MSLTSDISPNSPESSEQQLIQHDIDAYLAQHQSKELLRFVTVGSVDDGKSTLIGRLLHDTNQVYEDQLAAVKRASAKRETDIDFSLFTDGLKAEREQGITIDVAYRYFSTAKRKFIIADTPGHVQYTRNMATGASTANVALILIDARLGVLQQSRRHAFIASLLGIPHLLVCVNKMDLVGFDRAVFDAILQEFTEFTGRLGFKDVSFLPVSAKGGDNVVSRSAGSPWYKGPTLLEYLETVPIAGDRNHQSFRFPVQCVLRPNLDYRAFAGEVASGILRKGDTVMVLPSRKTSQVVAIDTFDGELPQAYPPMNVAIRLADEIDVSRGDMLVRAGDAPRVARRFDAMVVWLSERPLDLKKSYLLKHTTRYVRAQIDAVHHTVDLETLNNVPATHLELNDIGRVSITSHQPLYFDAYTSNRSTGAFIVVDTLTNNTVGAGMLLLDDTTERREAEGVDVTLRSQVSPEERRERLAQKGLVVLVQSAEPETAVRVSYALERRLFDLGKVAFSVEKPASQSSAELLATGAGLSQAGVVALLQVPDLGEAVSALKAQVPAQVLTVAVTGLPLAADAVRQAEGELRISLAEVSLDQAVERIASAVTARL